MNITNKSTMEDIRAFAKAHSFVIEDGTIAGLFRIRNLRIAEDVVVDLRGVEAFFIGYSQAKSRYF